MIYKQNTRAFLSTKSLKELFILKLQYQMKIKLSLSFKENIQVIRLNKKIYSNTKLSSKNL